MSYTDKSQGIGFIINDKGREVMIRRPQDKPSKHKKGNA